MASSINALSTGVGGLATTADASGILQIQTNGVAAIAIDAAQAITFLGAFDGSNITTGTVPAARLDLSALNGSNITTGTVAAARLGIAGSVVGTSDTQTLTSKTITGLRETKIALADLDVDISLGNYFSKTISAISTLTVSNVPTTGTVASFIIDLTNGGAYAVTWWAGMKWAAGTAPALTSAGRDVLGFFTHDGGTTWSGLVLAKDIK